jgi:hypothetical protein
VFLFFVCIAQKYVGLSPSCSTVTFYSSDAAVAAIRMFDGMVNSITGKPIKVRNNLEETV